MTGAISATQAQTDFRRITQELSDLQRQIASGVGVVCAAAVTNPTSRVNIDRECGANGEGCSAPTPTRSGGAPGRCARASST